MGHQQHLPGQRDIKYPVAETRDGLSKPDHSVGSRFQSARKAQALLQGRNHRVISLSSCSSCLIYPCKPRKNPPEIKARKKQVKKNPLMCKQTQMSVKWPAMFPGTAGQIRRSQQNKAVVYGLKIANAKNKLTVTHWSNPLKIWNLLL